MAKGIPEDQIIPRVNVFSYNAWKANGRQVRKGEHGVKCLTFITKTGKNGREERRPWTVTVFHVSQTEPVGTLHAPIAKEYVPVPSPVPSNWITPGSVTYGNEPDATPENIPYAGEEDTDEAELLDHSTAVHVNREIQKFSPDATVETFTLDENCELVSETDELSHRGREGYCAKCGGNCEYDANGNKRETPEPPKDSASVRAMRGEQVSIMDIIAELPKRETERRTNLVNKYGNAGAARIEAKRIQKDVVF
jgi:hypothetical protein